MDHVYCNECGREMLVAMGGSNYIYSCPCGDRTDAPDQEAGRAAHYHLLWLEVSDEAASHAPSSAPSPADTYDAIIEQLEAFRLCEIERVELFHFDLPPEKQAEESPFGGTLWTSLMPPKPDVVDFTKSAGDRLEL